MKKILFTSMTFLVLASVGYSSDLKGSDYISTKVGETYNYKRINADDKDSFMIETTVKSCNENKSSCQYTSQIKSSSEEKASDSKYEYSYNIKKDGSVYTDLTGSGKEFLFLPATIEFNKKRTESSSFKDGNISKIYEFKKQIPNMNVGSKTYKDCIELEADTTVNYKNKEHKVESQEFYCKGVGLVEENLKEIHKSKDPVTYKTILSSVESK
ncbi:hypothetical protein LO80_05770 [Candidatus Francisella endociliophora]|uniref:Uncharacterized protein n=1 Tax=Candidatus Francisella endociliophora TaxID=653937 RepID=A0A097EPM8_9GAMM|nr:hypothetical protein [Francisella sp. FSC1006]AIT09523.1 hypothetical protein LO80_05770 [Francisella sp. FSC1006]